MATKKIQVDVLINGTLTTTGAISGVINANQIADGSVSNTEFQYINSLTSNAQTQLDAKVDDTEKGAAGGVATLDGGGKVPASQLPSSVMDFKGSWNATTNSPTLADGTGDSGDVYRTSVAGTQNLGSGAQTFAVGDWVMYNGTIWQKSPATDAVTSVNGFTGAVTLDTGDIAEDTNLYFTDERAQDAVGTILLDTASVDLVYNDGTPSISATVLPAGVDHDALSNFVANEHIDHTAVSITTAANTGLAGGGTIAATRSLSIDITNATAETSADNADLLLIYDNSATALRKMTRANFNSGLALAGTGDLNETSFLPADGQAVAANVTGLAFANGSVRSFTAMVYVTIDATSDLFEKFTINGIQKAASWDITVESVGDDTGFTFSITSAGQIQYTSTTQAGYVSSLLKFRAFGLGV